MCVKLLLLFKYVIESFIGTKRYKLTNRIKVYLSSKDCNLSLQDKNELMSYLNYTLVSQISYPFRNRYLSCKVKVLKDKDNDLFFINHEGNKLYFKRALTKREIVDLYRCLCTEQDKNSPHCYSFKDDSFFNENVADIGAAEGIWGLSVIKDVNKLYLFECDEGWIEALKLTFAPWKEKVSIVNKYVSDKTERNMIRLDDFFYHEGLALSVIKADIEGAEVLMLKGAEKMIQEGVLKKIIVCTYHHPNDEMIISSLLSENYDITKSKGYMLDVYSNIDYDTIDISSAFRKGLIYAQYKY